jgi:hypothetical protein
MTATSERGRWDPYVTFPVVAAVVLGVIGFTRGFFGPLGISHIGQLGLVAGWGMGIAAAALRLSTRSFLLFVFAGAVAWSGVLLLWRHTW